MFDEIKKDLDNLFEDLIKPQRVDEKSEFVESRIIRNHNIFESIFSFFKDAGIYDQAFLCGGFVRHSCSERRPIVAAYGDVDVYCRYDEAYKILDEYFKNHSAFMMVFENDLCKCFRRKLGYSSAIFPTEKPIQLIKPIREGEIVATGDIETILNNFDFTVIRAGITLEMYYKNKHAMVDKDFQKHERQKRLVFRKIHCPISSLHRVIKYCNKGYKINSKETLKLFLDWESRPESYKTEIKTFLSKEFINDPQTGKLSPQDTIEINRMYHMLRVD